MAVQQTFDGDVVFITGAASGIGAQAARKLAAAGARVAIADIDLDRAKALAKELCGIGNGAEAVMVDVGQPSAIENAVNHVVKVFGGLKFAVNCAAITVPRVPLHECSLEAWRRVHAVNLDGTFYSCVSRSRQFLRRGAGPL
jgi:NAD(P)-dependent dehydrogenase (short-subunit alcohol dehydrogenase family)